MSPSPCRQCGVDSVLDCVTEMLLYCAADCSQWCPSKPGIYNLIRWLQHVSPACYNILSVCIIAYVHFCISRRSSLQPSHALILVGRLGLVVLSCRWPICANTDALLHSVGPSVRTYVCQYELLTPSHQVEELADVAQSEGEMSEVEGQSDGN